MKYSDILKFDPITEVIQFDKIADVDYQRQLVRTFVFTDYFLSTIIPLIAENLSMGGYDQKFGIQVVGNYGTGKSHLMSLISLVAEDEQLLSYLCEPRAKQILEPIAGKFKILHFEMGNKNDLWSLIKYNILQQFRKWDIDFDFEENSLKMYSQQLQEMMAAFEDKYPDKGFMLVIDEMLSYLKGRSSTGELDQDLQVLQALGQAGSNSRFRIMFGVQEMIYHAPEFQYAAQTLLKVKDRYKDVTIRKEDVAFVVKKRLLYKDEVQKNNIRTHLNRFVQYFTNLHSHTEEYVELFPVHPSFFENFQKIREGKSQREILKTLSKQFADIMDKDIPSDNPGLITYDHYWEEMASSPSMMAIPDFKKVAETVDMVHNKIDTNFTGLRAKQIPLAKRIANAAAIKILQGELSKHHGTNIETLVDDLCCTFPIMDNREFLLDSVKTCADHIVTATSGQYFEKDEQNQEYHLRTEGGVNFDEKIKIYAAQMSDSQKDEYFFKFLVQILGISTDPYRSGFKIYQHTIDWISHKVSREGYIFMGNPNEKSTTHPRQHFYIYFMPIFDDNKKNRKMEEDEVYFVMDQLSNEFKECVCRYGAAVALMGSADSSQMTVYRGKSDELLKQSRRLFEACYLQNTIVHYSIHPPKPLSAFSLPGEGSSKEEIFNSVASTLFEEYFLRECPYYPNFSQSSYVIGNDNRDRYIKACIAKLIKPNERNTDGEIVLSALGCWRNGEIDIEESIYAQSLLRLMREKGDQKVLNRVEILEMIPHSSDLWISKDYKLEAAFEFIVLAAMVAVGEIEIRLSNGEVTNASNLDSLRSLDTREYFCFAHINRPKGVNLPVLKEIFQKMLGKDLTKRLDKEDTYLLLTTEAKNLVDRLAEVISLKVSGEYQINGVVLISEDDAMKYRRDLTEFKGFCEKLSTYTSLAKIKNIPWELEKVKRLLSYKEELEYVEHIYHLVEELQTQVNYLTQAKQYVPNTIELFGLIDKTINKLSQVLELCNDNEVENYKGQLKEVHNKYVDWYMKQYTQHCISHIEENKRLLLLNSNEYKMCEILCGASFLSDIAYESWKRQFKQLRVIDDNVTVQALEQTPYMGFNPLDFIGKETKSVQILKQELKNIYDGWILEMKAMIQETDVKENMSLLAPDDKKFLDNFIVDFELIDNQQSANRLISLLSQLYEGFSTVELSLSDLSGVFKRALTVEEAKETFANYIDKCCSGKDSSKVRIILK